MGEAVVSNTDAAVFVVTAGNRGLGLEHVKQLLQKAKVHVVATVRQAANAEDLNKLAHQHQGRVSVVQLDISDEQSIEVFITRTASFASLLVLALSLPVNQMCDRQPLNV